MGLTWEQRISILDEAARDGISKSRIAKEIGVPASTLLQIISRKTNRSKHLRKLDDWMIEHYGERPVKKNLRVYLSEVESVVLVYLPCAINGCYLKEPPKPGVMKLLAEGETRQTAEYVATTNIHDARQFYTREEAECVARDIGWEVIEHQLNPDWMDM